MFPSLILKKKCVERMKTSAFRRAVFAAKKKEKKQNQK